MFLDAGHGGKDQGAISATGVTEAQINASFVAEFKAAAELKGIKVVLINKTTEYTSLTDRANAIKSYKLAQGEEAVLVSMHANFSKDPLKSGKEVIYTNLENSKDLATSIAKAIDGTVMKRSLTLLRSVSIPAIVIEAGYLSNQNDLNNIMTPDMRSIMIDKIVAVLAK